MNDLRIKNKFTYLIRTIVLNVIRKAIIIPRTIDTDDDDDEVLFLFSINDGDNERDEHRTSIENIFGGGPIVNSGGGGNLKQR